MTKTAKTKEVETAILRMLEAIRPEVGNLRDLKSQRQLIRRVIEEHGLQGNVEQQRSRLTRVVREHAVHKGRTRAADIFDKPAHLVIDSDYLDDIGFRIPEGDEDEHVVERGSKKRAISLSSSPNYTLHKSQQAGPDNGIDSTDPQDNEDETAEQRGGKKRIMPGHRTANDFPRKRQKVRHDYREYSSSPDVPTRSIASLQPLQKTPRIEKSRKAGPSAGTAITGNRRPRLTLKLTASPSARPPVRPVDSSLSSSIEFSEELRGTPKTGKDITSSLHVASADDGRPMSDTIAQQLRSSPSPYTSIEPTQAAAVRADTIPDSDDAAETATIVSDELQVRLSHLERRAEAAERELDTLKKEHNSQGDLQKQLSKFRQRAEIAEKESEMSKNKIDQHAHDDLQTKLVQSEQRAEAAEKESEMLKEKIVRHQAESQNDLLGLQQRADAAGIETATLKKDLAEARTQIRQLRAQRPLFGKGDGLENASKPPGKAEKSSMYELKRNSRDSIKNEMHALYTDTLTLASACCDEKEISCTATTDFITYPSPELEALYAQVLQSDSAHDWKRTQTGVKLPQIRSLTSLIAASVLQSVFNAKMPWDERDAIEASLADLARYTETDEEDRLDQLVRDIAFRRSKARTFQEGDLAQHAKKLAADLTVTLTPHVDRMAPNKPASMCSDEWVSRLEAIFRGALKIKTTIDTYDEGYFSFFWLDVGSKMIPLLTDPHVGHKHRAQEIRNTQWPGLRMTIEGEDDVILSQASAVTVYTDKDDA